MAELQAIKLVNKKGSGYLFTERLKGGAAQKTMSASPFNPSVQFRTPLNCLDRREYSRVEDFGERPAKLARQRFAARIHTWQSCKRSNWFNPKKHSIDPAISIWSKSEAASTCLMRA